ncbi:MAG: sulfotransferase family protein [Gammaproteobacteria bacterium]|nr:sulfotransferase family protein [Gammaproteobacteria bacterium]
MSLKVIGAGFGRTGTTSMKEALELLGYDKCHHMREVMSSGKQVEMFDRVSRNVEVDWDDVFEGFEAAVDWPAAARYEELMEKYPEAKVILTARDPEAWYESTKETIYALSNSVPPIIFWLIPRARNVMAMVQRLIWEGVFDGRFEEKQYAIDAYNKNVAEVIANVPDGRLLVHSSKEGWQPLCEFLDKPIPSQPYPHSNESTVMKRAIVGLKVLDVLLWGALLIVGVWIAYSIYSAI